MCSSSDSIVEDGVAETISKIDEIINKVNKSNCTIKYNVYLFDIPNCITRQKSSAYKKLLIDILKQRGYSDISNKFKRYSYRVSIDVLYSLFKYNYDFRLLNGNLEIYILPINH